MGLSPQSGMSPSVGGPSRSEPPVRIDWKPEPLKHILSGAWSRRIDDTNRLVYYVTDEHIVILQTRWHYL